MEENTVQQEDVMEEYAPFARNFKASIALHMVNINITR